MNQKIILSICLIIGMVASMPIPYPTPWFPLNGKPLKHFKFEMNDPPRVRWAPVLKEFENEFQAFVKEIHTLVPIPQFVYKVAAAYGNKYFPYPDYVQEIRTIAELTNTDFGLVFVLNFLYDLTAIKMCTSMIIRNDEGRILHGRNLDFPFMRGLAHISFTGEFYRNGQLVYIANMMAGSVGYVTGMKPGKFAVTIDSRYTGTVLENIVDLATGIDFPVMYLLRKVFEEEDTFEAAVRKLSYSRLASPVYFIVSGVKKNEGVIIQRERFGPHAVYRLNEDRWFLVVSNYDRNIDDPPIDMRRLPAEGRIINLGQKINEQIILDNVLMKWPTLNIGTIYSITMSPETGYYNTTLYWD